MPRARVKAGTSKAAAAERRKAFAREYIRNGRNGTQAAITAGFAPNSADVQAAQLLTDPRVRALIDEMTASAAQISGLSLERTLQEVARLAYADPRRMFRPDGTLIPVHEMDDDVAATVASIEHETKVTNDEDGVGTIARVAKLKTWDKNAALEKAMKHLGAYEKDNAQRGENLAVTVKLL
jgi:phage terminase small subunit